MNVSQFLDGPSNLKAGCKENAFYDALDAIYVSCIHNSNSNFYVNFSPSSGNDMRHCPAILYPAQMEVGGATVGLY